MAHNIPKIIWQTHNYMAERLPMHMRKAIFTWKNLNPQWEYRYSDHIQRLNEVNKYPELAKIYPYLDPVGQADIWRYIVTYEYGGVYSDMDSVCCKPLDYMLDGIDAEMVVVPRNPTDNKTNNANYAIKSKSDIMKKILDMTIENVVKFGADYKSPLDCFKDTVEESKNISYEFTSEIHSKDFKEKVPSNYIVDYYGKKMQYDRFLKENNIKVYDNFL